MTHCRITWTDQETGIKGHDSTFPIAKQRNLQKIVDALNAKEPHINHKVELI